MSAARDPVCGKEVDPLRARAVGIFGGVTYFFCSADCKAKYADPRRGGSAPPDGQPERRKKASPFAAPAVAEAPKSDEEKLPRSPSGKFASFDPTPLPKPIAAAELAPLASGEHPLPTSEMGASRGLPWRFILPALAVGALIALVLVLRH